jgi:hypothetical protein
MQQFLREHDVRNKAGKLVHVHGLPRSFRQWSSNVLRDSYDKATEVQMDHKPKGTYIGRLYDGPVLLEVRRIVVDRWCEHVLAPPVELKLAARQTGDRLTMSSISRSS